MDYSDEELDVLFTEYFQNYMGDLKAYTGSILRQPMDSYDVSDVIADVFCKAWKDRHIFGKKEGSMHSWIKARVRNRALDILKKQKEVLMASLDRILVEEKKPELTLFREVISGKQLMPFTCWLLFSLGYTQNEIGDLLSLSRRQVQYRIKLFEEELGTISDSSD